MSEQVWIPDRSWRLAASGDYRTCRMRGCDKRGVVELNRGILTKQQGRRPSWWAYCEDHLYGRRIEDGVVLHQVSANSPAAERGWV